MDQHSINRCKCCLEHQVLKNMWKEHYSDGQKEIYGFMIKDCFVVPWDPPLDKLEYICETCITNLRVAVKFKEAMLMSEKKLNDYFNKEIEKKLKVEESDIEIETELTIEYLDDKLSVDEMKKEIKTEEQMDTSCYKKEKYSQEDLDRCVEDVRSKSLSRVKASIIYNIPTKIISEALSNSESDQPPADQEKSHNDAISSHQTQSSQGSQNIETGHNQDLLKPRHNNSVRVNNNKDSQKRYKEQNREKLKQREAERRKRIKLSKIIAGSSSNTNGIELNKEEITAQSSSGSDKIQPSIQRNDQGNKLNALQKKRQRQKKYREQNRDKLKQREKERRRLRRTTIQ